MTIKLNNIHFDEFKQIFGELHPTIKLKITKILLKRIIKKNINDSLIFIKLLDIDIIKRISNIIYYIYEDKDNNLDL